MTHPMAQPWGISDEAKAEIEKLKLENARLRLELEDVGPGKVTQFGVKQPTVKVGVWKKLAYLRAVALSMQKSKAPKSMQKSKAPKKSFVKLIDIKAGQLVEVDNGFDCLTTGPHIIDEDAGGPYLHCHNGKHYLSGQVDDGIHCIGVYDSQLQKEELNMATEVEQELVKAAKFKGGKLKERQDYLAGLVRALEKMPQDDIDGLSDPAYDWWREAVSAMDHRLDVPEFANGGLQEPTPPNPPPPPMVEPDDPVPHDDEGDEDPEYEEPDEGDADFQGAENTPPSISDIQPQVPKLQPRPPTPQTPTRYDHITGERDRYNCHIGTKCHDAIEMFERGATMNEVRAECGDSKYNLLRRLQKEGHRVEKDGHTFLLIHKNDVK